MTLKDSVEEYLDESLRNKYLSKIFEEMALIEAGLSGPRIETGFLDLLFSEENFLDLFKKSENYLL